MKPTYPKFTVIVDVWSQRKDEVKHKQFEFPSGELADAFMQTLPCAPTFITRYSARGSY